MKEGGKNLEGGGEQAYWELYVKMINPWEKKSFLD